MTAPLTPLAAALPTSVPFVGPETQERLQGFAFRARIGANENMFGPSPKAVAAMAQAAAQAWMYGDPECFDLKAALAAHHRVAAEHVVVGEGIDGLLGLLVRLFVGAGDAVATSAGAYPTFNFHVTGYGGVIHLAPYRGWHEDPQALLDLARHSHAKLIYLANPDNPMGSHHPAHAIEAMIEALPHGTLLVLDEAYIEFAPDGTAPRIAADDPRVIRLRTFSKAYGLAGARVGYAIAAAPLAQAFDKVRNHFGVGRVVQAAALAALADPGHLDWLQGQITTARAGIAQIAGTNGLTALPSATNFSCLDLGRDKAHAQRVLAALRDQGIFIRMPGVAPLDRCIRISLGDAAAMQAFALALPIALQTAQR